MGIWLYRLSTWIWICLRQWLCGMDARWWICTTHLPLYTFLPRARIPYWLFGHLKLGLEPEHTHTSFNPYSALGFLCANCNTALYPFSTFNRIAWGRGIFIIYLPAFGDFVRPRSRVKCSVRSIFCPPCLTCMYLFLRVTDTDKRNGEWDHVNAILVSASFPLFGLGFGYTKTCSGFWRAMLTLTRNFFLLFYLDLGTTSDATHVEYVWKNLAFSIIFLLSFLGTLGLDRNRSWPILNRLLMHPSSLFPRSPNRKSIIPFWYPDDRRDGELMLNWWLVWTLDAVVTTHDELWMQNGIHLIWSATVSCWCRCPQIPLGVGVGRRSVVLNLKRTTFICRVIRSPWMFIGYKNLFPRCITTCEY